MDERIPKIDTESANKLLELAKEKARQVSEGKLTNFTPSSPVTAILEAMVLIAEELQSSINNLASEIEQNRLKIFNISRQNATKSTGTIKVKLDSLYPNPFQLPRGFKLFINGVQFETTTDLVIPAFVDEGEAIVESVYTGVATNVKNESPSITYTSIFKVSTISLVDDISGGIDQESIDEYNQRVYSLIRRRDTLVSEEDFETDLKDYLGEGSTALAIGRLKPDKISFENGYVYVFGLNPDSSVLNQTQIAQLQDYYTSRVAMATVSIDSLSFFEINVRVIATFASRFSAEVLNEEIKIVVESYLSSSNLIPGSQIMNKALEHRIQGIDGIVEGAISVTLNGLAQPVDMPNRWYVPKLGKLETTLIAQGTSNAFDFN